MIYLLVRAKGQHGLNPYGGFLMKHAALLAVLAILAMAILAGCSGGNSTPVNPNADKLEIWQMVFRTDGISMVQRNPSEVQKYIQTEFRIPGFIDPVPVALTSQKTGEIINWPATGGTFSGIQALKAPWLITSTKEDWTVTINALIQPLGLAENYTQTQSGSVWHNTTQVLAGTAVRWVDDTGEVIPMFEFWYGPGPQPIKGDGEVWYFSPTSVGYWVAVAGSGMETAFEVVAG